MFVYAFDPDISDQGILKQEIYPNGTNSSEWGLRGIKKVAFSVSLVSLG
jgi:hypothetical protein